MRHLLARYVPDSVMDRPKQGFTPPIATWLTGQLRDWAEHLIHADYDRAARPEISAAWRKLLAGDRRFGDQVWTWLAYASWAESRGVS